jgi:hypothetical protein
MEDGGWKMAIIRSFRDLDVYRMAKDEARRIFLLSRSFPREEQYSLTDQIRRASRAVGAMLNRMIQRTEDFCTTE